MPFSFTWPNFEFKSVNCAIDTYSVTCYDPDYERYKVGFNGEIILNESFRCSEFKYDLESRTITLETVEI